MAKYGEKAQKKVGKALHEHKHDDKYQSKQQAVAAGLNKAREAGGKVPNKKSDKK